MALAERINALTVCTIMTEENIAQDDEMICGLTVAQRDVLQMKLRELPDTMPPRAVWQRIEEQARAEGLLNKPGLSEPVRWYAGVGLAAAVVLAVIILPNAANRGDLPLTAETEIFSTVPEYSDNGALTGYPPITALMVRSQVLERDLRALPQGPRVHRASTTATIFDLQDRIAAIDFQLSQAGSSMTPEQQQVFWGERVRLMDLLLRVRYAQTQRMAF